jgi:hypothetical protein
MFISMLNDMPVHTKQILDSISTVKEITVASYNIPQDS